jgi:hypothetical protein
MTHHKKAWPVDVMNRLLGGSRNGYYRYCQRQRDRIPDSGHEAMIAVVKKVDEDLTIGVHVSQCTKSGPRGAEYEQRTGGALKMVHDNEEEGTSCQLTSVSQPVIF